MTMINPELEQRRLTEFYASQTDGEVENVASQAFELTGPAREALRAELYKRGLYIGQLEESEPTGQDRLGFRTLVTIRSFWNLAEAELAKGLLDSAEIESFLFDENMGRLYWMNVIMGVRLRVDAENAEIASRILDENISELAATENVVSDEPDASDPDPST